MTHCIIDTGSELTDRANLGKVFGVCTSLQEEFRIYRLDIKVDILPPILVHGTGPRFVVCYQITSQSLRQPLVFKLNYQEANRMLKTLRDRVKDAVRS